MMKKLPRMLTNKKEKYFHAFFIPFAIMMLVLMPAIIINKGIFLYYGDFNSQQLPFYFHAHDLVRSGVLWDWGTDLGTNFLGSYSFYLLGSPFFWLTLPFPNSVVVYLIPWLLAIKTGVAGLTSYLFIKRFVKNKNACIIGSMLYALSGFQLYNIFFNHFHDVVAFFPLLLIALEEKVQNNKHGYFAVTVAICSMINYFFFTGQVTFLIIYFICRCRSDDFNITFKKFVSLMIESILGVMVSAIILLPSFFAVINNPRVDDSLLGHDMLIYNDKFRIIRIIQSFFMIPDVPARSNLFSANSARWASIAGYLPLFSMAGVIAFMREKKKHWMKTVTIVCIIFAFIPILNSSFYAFNSSYYARWFYMPILIMCAMTAYALDSSKISLKKGVPICVGMLIFFGIAAILPTRNEDTSVLKFGSLPEYKGLFWVTFGITVIGTVLLIIIAYYVKRNKRQIKLAFKLTIVACFLCTATVTWYGVLQHSRSSEYISEAINGASKIDLPEDDFYRIDISYAKDNYPMFWKKSSIRTFHSVVSPSIMEFYQGLNISRDVASRPKTERFPLRSLLSVKYYFNKPSKEVFEMEGFEYIGNQNDFDVYENKNYIPIGFTFDYYMTKEQFELKTNYSRDGMLLKALLLDEKQIEKYKNVLSPIPENELTDYYTKDILEKDCLDRKENACHYFKTNGKGFVSKINLDRENLVFFSVPYDKGFKATVNGKSVKIEKVDNGLSAVLCPAGENIEIVFKYSPQGLKIGFIISLFSIILLATYLIINRRIKYVSKKSDDENYEIISTKYK